MLLSDENKEIYNNLCIKSTPVFEMIMNDKRHTEDYKKGFTDGFHQVKSDLISVLMPPLSVSAIKSISSAGHKNLLEVLLKTMGKIDAFFNLVETNDDTESLHLLIWEDLSYLQEIIEEDFL